MTTVNAQLKPAAVLLSFIQTWQRTIEQTDDAALRRHLACFLGNVAAFDAVVVGFIAGWIQFAETFDRAHGRPIATDVAAFALHRQILADVLAVIQTMPLDNLQPERLRDVLRAAAEAAGYSDTEFEDAERGGDGR